MATRWNIESEMLQRPVELKVAISAKLCESDRVENFTPSQQRCDAALTSIPQPLAEATAKLSGGTYPTVPQAIPVLRRVEFVPHEHISEQKEGAKFASCRLKKFKIRSANKRCALLLHLLHL